MVLWIMKVISKNKGNSRKEEVQGKRRTMFRTGRYTDSVTEWEKKGKH